MTRPSIDPYREEIETSVYLGRKRLRLTSPFFFTHLPESVPSAVVTMFASVATSMGLLLDIDAREEGALAPYGERILSDAGSGFESELKAIRLGSFPGGNDSKGGNDGDAQDVVLRSPTSWSAIAEITKLVNTRPGVTGIILDEDDPRSDMQIEAAVSVLDRELKENRVRGKISLIAEGNGIRGSDDIFKLVALGADCVGIGKAALLAIGMEEGDREILLDARALQRLENFVSATQKDIKLLAGAAGISNINSTLTGNRELLRSIDMEPSSRIELGVKPAGAA